MARAFIPCRHGGRREACVRGDAAGVACSAGSACTAGSLTPSHVLTAMFGQDSPKVSESIRISFGRYNTVEEVEAFAAALVKVARKLQDRKRED